MRTAPAVLPVVAAALVAGCYNLNKLDPGPRWIDDFSEWNTPTSNVPTWNAISPWVCVYSLSSSTGQGGGSSAGGPGDGAAAGTEAGQGGGSPGGGVRDGGAEAGGQTGTVLETCLKEGPGDDNPADTTDKNDLAFQFALPADMDAVVETQMSRGPVDFTGFRQFVFSAKLESFSPQSPLPVGTGLTVELGCQNGSDDLATQPVLSNMLTIDSTVWWRVRLDLSGFALLDSTGNQTCLSKVTSIDFRVSPGLTNMAPVSGTLSLDNISLQN